jgi:hypothetical protein
MLLVILIIFFISIIFYKILFYIGTSFHLIEGLENSTEYKEYGGNDPLILAQQNAGNIEYLKSRVEEVTNVKNDVNTMKQDMQTMQIQVDGLVQQQADMATELSGGGEPLSVDGLDDEEDEAEEGEVEGEAEEEEEV